MITKIQNSAHERFYRGGNVLILNINKNINVFLKHKIKGLYRGLLIPDDLIGEAERFMDRNFIENGNYECCPRCLKAFVLIKAKEMSLPEKEIKFLSTILPGEIGHNGFFLDENKVEKIEPN